MTAKQPCSVLALSRSRPDVVRFLKVSYQVYNGDPHWVARYWSTCEGLYG
jgi:hypothetical protein